jgi:hypothetical protein
MSPAEILKAYEQGKERRYKLLFAVNGGAFAIAKLVADESSPDLGDLALWQISIGMILFTTLMVVDIFFFGQNMHRQDENLFRWPGKLILFMLGLLICTGWFMVSINRLGKVGGITLGLVYVGSFVLAFFVERLGARKKPIATIR